MFSSSIGRLGIEEIQRWETVWNWTTPTVSTLVKSSPPSFNVRVVQTTRAVAL